MKRLTNFLRNAGRAIKQMLTDRRGYNDMVMMAQAIISMVFVVVILAPLFEALNCEYKYPLLVVVAIPFAFIIVSVILRQLAS